MGKVYLETCSKEQLKHSIDYMLKNATLNTYIYLENYKETNPILKFRNDDNQYRNAFGWICAGYYGVGKNNKPYNELMECIETDEGGYLECIIELDDFIDNLWEYILEYYR